MKNLTIAILASLFLAACGSASKSTSESAGKAEKAASKTMSEKATPAAAATSGKASSCTLAKDTRTIEVKPKDKGCELHYTKFGETKTVATSAYTVDHCEKVLERMTKRLSEAGFSCQK